MNDAEDATRDPTGPNGAASRESDRRNAGAPAREQLECDLLGWQMREAGATEMVARWRARIRYSDFGLECCQVAIEAAHAEGLSVRPAIIAAKVAAANPELSEETALNFLQSYMYAAPAVASDHDLKRQIDATIEAIWQSDDAQRRRVADKILREEGIEGIEEAQAVLDGRPSASSSGALSGPPILDSAEFVSGFNPPDYLLDGVLQRGFLYSNTGQTGTGKTAIALRLLAHAALGKSLAGREMQQCHGLMLVGENADDVRARWIALGEQMGFIPREMPIHFVPSIFSVQRALPILKQRASDVGGFGLIVVDTSAAYFEGDEENSNKQLGDHARALRTLTNLEARPCVIANCHPTKGAGEDQLLPRGGGAFLAEVDGNLITARKDGAVELHWAGKIRGPDFDPVAFELLTIHSDLLRDSRGRHVPTVIAHPLSHDEQTAHASNANRDLHRLISAMAEKPGGSIAELAQEAGWIGSGGLPMKSKVSRLLNELKRNKLANKGLDSWELTPAGTKLAQRGEK